VSDLTQFDRQSANRIARVVRAVEGEPQQAKPLTFEPAFQQRQRPVFRICTFSGQWNKGTQKVVTLADASTMSANNVLWPVPDGPPRYAGIARDGTVWHLVAPEMFALDAVASIASAQSCSITVSKAPFISFATAATATQTIQVSDYCTAISQLLTSLTATADVTVMTGATLTTAALTFARSNVLVLRQTTASTVSISITTCATATAS
jgi:hypothetical protein